MKALLSRLGIGSRGDVAALCRQFLKFGFVGLSNTAITLTVQYAFMYFGVGYRPAYIAGFLMGTINSFYWNSKYVFRTSRSGMFGRYAKLAVSNTLTLLVGLGVMTLLVERFSMSDQIAPLLNLGLTVPLNFLLARLWVFKTSGSD